MQRSGYELTSQQGKRSSRRKSASKTKSPSDKSRPDKKSPARVPDVLYQTIVETAQEGIWVINSELKTTYANQIMAEMLGLAHPSEMIGKSVLDFMDEQNKRLAPSRIEQRLTGRVDRYEINLIRKDGTHVWAMVSASPLFDDHGQFIGSLGMVTDITEQRQWDHEAVRIYEHSLDMLGSANFDGYFTRLNAAWEKTTGYTREELLARPYLDFVHPDDRERTIAEAQKLNEGVPTLSFENRYLCKDGTYKWISWNSFPDWQNKAIYFVARDVTQFRQLDEEVKKYQTQLEALVAERTAQIERLYEELESYNQFLEQAVTERTQDLRSTKDRVEAILSSVGDALLVLGKNSHIKQVNLAFEQQTGFSAMEAVGHDHHDLLQLEFGSKGDYQGALEMLNPGQVWKGQTKVVRKDGSTYDADMTIAPVRDDAGTIHLLVAIIRDITPLKEAERAKDQFVSNVSHELRTPITALKLNHSLIVRNPERQDVYLGRLGREINRLNELIEDLLQLSRLEQGGIELTPTPLDLNSLGAELVTDRIPMAEARQLTLTFEANPDAQMVQGDSGLIVQALSILLTNAMNYTPAGGHITVSAVTRGDGRRRWIGLRVSDTGPGVAPEEQSRLFERFYRGQVGRSSGAPGTGLGLSIARQIAERHRGRMEVSSEGIPGKGAAFTIWLPIE